MGSKGRRDHYGDNVRYLEAPLVIDVVIHAITLA